MKAAPGTRFPGVELMDEQSNKMGVTTLPVRVLKSLARTTRIRSGGAILEVGSVRPTALQDWSSLGYTAQVLTDSAPATPSAPGQVFIGDVAGGMPVTAHSMDCIVLRTAKTFRQGLDAPESLLGAANLLSCLKPHGSLVILDSESVSLAGWKAMLTAFPVKISSGEYRDGLMFWLSFGFLSGRALQIPYLRVEIGKEAISRLQWHRIVRELVMKKMQDHQAKAA